MTPTHASTLATFQGWHLIVHCAECSVARSLTVNDIAR
jgi:hypothetical protein